MITMIRGMLRDPRGRSILLWATAQILVGTLVFRWLEGWSFVDSVYFSVITLATVGFGDLHPTSDAAKIFTIFYVLFGLGILAAFITELNKQHAATLAHLRTRLTPTARRVLGSCCNQSDSRRREGGRTHRMARKPGPVTGCMSSRACRARQRWRCMAATRRAPSHNGGR